MPTHPPDAFRLRDLVLPIYLPTLLFAVGLGAVVPVIPLYARDLGAGDGLVGVIVALRALGTTALDVPAGVASTRFGHPRTIAAASAVCVVAGVLGALSGGNAALAGAVLVIGAGTALFMTARLAFLAETVPLARRGRALALVGGTHRIGLFAGPVIGGFVGRAFGLEVTFVLLAVSVGAAGLLVLATMRPPAVEAPPLRPGNAYAHVARTVGTHRRVFLTAGAAMVALAVLRAAREILIPLRGDDIGLDVAEIGIIFGASSAIDMTFFYPIGVVMDRWGRKWAAVPSLILLAVALALVPAADGLGWLLAVGLLAGIGNGLGSGINMTLGTDLAPRDRPGEFLGAWRLVSDAGRVVAPFGIGFVAQAAALSVAAFLVGGVGLIGALVMATLVRETLRPPAPAARPSPPADAAPASDAPPPS